MNENLNKALPGKYNLYKLTLKGHLLHTCYVVAKDPAEAQRMVLEPIEKDNLGLPSNRIVRKIELVAQDTLSNEIGAYLFIDHGGWL